MSILISAVVALAENQVIGDGKTLLWHLPNDLKRFKNMTWGHPIIMGRKTYESIGKPLEGRLNIVLSKNLQIKNERGMVQVCSTKEQAIEIAQEAKTKEIFVIGGGEIYALFMPEFKKLYVTKVHQVIEGKTTFPKWNTAEWKKTFHQSFEADQKHAYSYSFEDWIKE